MRDKVESEVAEEQAGFRSTRGTTEHLCNLRLIPNGQQRADNRYKYVSSILRKFSIRYHTRTCGLYVEYGIRTAPGLPDQVTI